AHWADDGLLDLVEEVVFRLDEVPLVVLCTSRPELLERRSDFGRAARNVTQVELRPLTTEAADELAVALLPPEERRLAGRVARASGGNPFFAEEVAQAIVDGRRGALHQLPDTVQAAVAARLAGREAARVAARRGAMARAQELFEQAAELADPPQDRVAALRFAGDLALHRWRGDDTLRLLREAAEVSEEAGLRDEAAVTY